MGESSWIVPAEDDGGDAWPPSAPRVSKSLLQLCQVPGGRRRVLKADIDDGYFRRSTFAQVHHRFKCLGKGDDASSELEGAPLDLVSEVAQQQCDLAWSGHLEYVHDLLLVLDSSTMVLARPHR